MAVTFLNSESCFVPNNKIEVIGNEMNKMKSNPLATGSVLCDGEYIVKSVIGYGGFGITYSAVSTYDKSIVAIKELFMSRYCFRDYLGCVHTFNTASARNSFAQARRLFLDEPLSIMNCTHNNIIKAFDRFFDNDTVYYVMELLPGNNLEKVLKMSNGISVNKAVAYVLDIADAVDYMHRYGIVHLDIKPSNIMVRNTGEAVLIDFGSSRHYAENDCKYNSPAILSRGYFSQEMYDDSYSNPANYTRMDIYALGVTLYRLITNKHLTGYDDQFASVPDAVKKVIEKATDISEKGYHSVSEFISDLRTVNRSCRISMPENKSYRTCA